MKRKNFLLPVAIVLIIAAIATLTAVAYKRSEQRTIPLVFSNNAMLLELWDSYKQQNIDQGTNRTVDRQSSNITTSEGESYTMLRAVWSDDQTTFDNSWAWTQQNLQRPDNLFSWKYGPLANGHYGIQKSVGGQNTASDGDTDIALSLLMAYSRWNDPKYLTAAKLIIANIWSKEVISVNGKPVLSADDLERNDKTSVVVNPSYFSPYSFKIFAKVDKTPGHDWTALTNNSYALLSSLSQSNLDKKKSDGLPPDWVQLNRTTGAFLAPTNNATTNYSFDAIRVPWRLALDYQWFHDPRDKILLNQFSFLKTAWRTTEAVDANYAHDGTIVGKYQTPATYGASLGYFIVSDPSDAKTIYKQKLQTLYDPNAQGSIPNLGYYDANWAWFGIALAQGALPNLTAHT